jgi:hypothetical protein
MFSQKLLLDQVGQPDPMLLGPAAKHNPVALGLVVGRTYRVGLTPDSIYSIHFYIFLIF